MVHTKALIYTFNGTDTDWTESHTMRSVPAPIKFIWTKEDIFHPAAECMCIIKFEHFFWPHSKVAVAAVTFNMLPMPP